MRKGKFINVSSWASWLWIENVDINSDWSCADKRISCDKMPDDPPCIWKINKCSMWFSSELYPISFRIMEKTLLKGTYTFLITYSWNTSHHYLSVILNTANTGKWTDKQLLWKKPYFNRVSLISRAWSRI